MMPCPDMKKEPNLMITPAEFPVPLIILPETDSTNNYLTQLCGEQQSVVREFTTVIAERQTAGKGQQQLGVRRLPEHHIQLRALSHFR